jgi:hypothetical protein
LINDTEGMRDVGFKAWKLNLAEKSFYTFNEAHIHA